MGNFIRHLSRGLPDLAGPQMDPRLMISGVTPPSSPPTLSTLSSATSMPTLIPPSPDNGTTKVDAPYSPSGSLPNSNPPSFASTSSSSPSSASSTSAASVSSGVLPGSWRGRSRVESLWEGAKERWARQQLRSAEGGDAAQEDNDDFNYQGDDDDDMGDDDFLWGDDDDFSGAEDAGREENSVEQHNREFNAEAPDGQRDEFDVSPSSTSSLPGPLRSASSLLDFELESFPKPNLVMLMDQCRSTGSYDDPHNYPHDDDGSRVKAGPAVESIVAAAGLTSASSTTPGGAAQESHDTKNELHGSTGRRRVYRSWRQGQAREMRSHPPALGPLHLAQVMPLYLLRRLFNAAHDAATLLWLP